MKLFLCISITLSLLGAALGNPVDEYLRGRYRGRYGNYAGTQYFQPYDANANAREYAMEDVKQPVAQYNPTDTEDESMPELEFINMETRDQENNDKEVQDQAQSSNNYEEVKVQNAPSCTVANANPNAVTQGATIALQLIYQKLQWLGCAGNPCGKAGCPRLFMEGNDWNACWGEVFQIYRQSGPSPVKVGDVIGIYFPRGQSWFALSGGRGHKEGCPGKPTTRYGFQSPHQWRVCWGEVFQIYAKGKKIGDIIESHDAIMIYFIRGQKWVGLVGNNPDLRDCPGKTRPPPSDRYDICWGEIFEIVLKKT